jgi:hypothetical protein
MTTPQALPATTAVIKKLNINFLNGSIHQCCFLCKIANNNLWITFLGILFYVVLAKIKGR